MPTRAGMLAAAVALLSIGCGEMRVPSQPSSTGPSAGLPDPWDMIAFTGNTPGEYNVTLNADPACLSLPDAVRQRSYTATIFPYAWDLNLLGTFHGVKRRSNPSWDFWTDLGGRSSVAVYVGNYYEDLGFIEDVEGGLLMMIGRADVSPVGSTLTGRLSGTFGYCGRSSAVGDSFETACLVAPIRCDSDNHRIVLERHRP